MDARLGETLLNVSRRSCGVQSEGKPSARRRVEGTVAATHPPSRGRIVMRTRSGTSALVAAIFAGTIELSTHAGAQDSRRNPTRRRTSRCSAASEADLGLRLNRRGSRGGAGVHSGESGSTDRESGPGARADQCGVPLLGVGVGAPGKESCLNPVGPRARLRVWPLAKLQDSADGT